MAFGIKVDLDEKKEGLEPINNPPPEPPTPPTDNQPPTPPNNEPPVAVDMTPESVLAYINKDREVKYEDYDDIFKPTEVEVEKIVNKDVNPYADVFDNEDESYFKFKRETGLGREEHNFLQQDISKLSALDLAKKQVQTSSGMDLDENSLKEYLESTLQIDFSEDKLSTIDQIKLNGFVKPTRDNISEQQEKYRTTKAAPKQPIDEREMVELEGGKKMPKAEYEELLKTHNTYIDNVTKGVNSVASIGFSTEVDDNGDKRKVAFNYEPSEDDKQSMLSVSDVNKMIQETYNTEEGFNHKQLAVDTWRGKEKNFNKLIGLAMEKARAETIEEMIAKGNNENFSRQPIPKSKTDSDGYGELPTGERQQSGYGVKVNV